MKTIYLLLASLLISGISQAQKKEDNMTTAQKNKTTLKRLYEEGLNKRNLAILEDVIAADYTNPQGEQGPAAFKATMVAIMNGFPDIQWHVKEMIAEDDKVFIRWQIEGTHTGQFTQFRPTGKKITNTGMAVYTFKNNRITETQVHTDRLAFLQGLGILPADPAALSFSKPDEVYFIDKFIVPAAAMQEFSERVAINRRLIKTLPGFLEDAEYTHTDNDGNLVCITVARWENKAALDKAKAAVQAEYQREGFDPAAMMKRLNVVMDRGLYTREIQ